MVQKDLAEYTCTMSADTSKAVATTSDKIKESLKVAKFSDMTIEFAMVCVHVYSFTVDV